MSHENIMRLWNDAVKFGRIRPKLKVVVKTASYTITPDDYGTVFTTRGATGQVNFTLPAASTDNKTNWVLFINVADQNMYVAGDDDGLVTFNNLAADNVGFATAGELIGGALLAISDGTSWIVLPIGEEAQSISVDATSTATATATASSTPSASTTSSATTSASISQTGTPTSTRTATDTQTATATTTTSGSTTRSATASTSVSKSTSASTTATRTPTSTQTATSTGTTTPSATASATASSTATATATP